MTPADLSRVSAIETTSFSNPWNRTTFRDLLPRSDAELWVAEVQGDDAEPDNQVVGYLVVWFAADEAELADLAVAPEYRGRGIGALLVARAIELSLDRGVRSLFLEVRASNDRAAALYRSRGFRVITVRKEYYKKPREDALVMFKSLW